MLGGTVFGADEITCGGGRMTKEEQEAYSKAWWEGYRMGMRMGEKELRDKLCDLLGLYERFQGREDRD